MTPPTTARTRIKDWIKVYRTHALSAPEPLLSCSFQVAPLHLSDLESLVEAFDKPCGSCHPCMNYADETWRAAGRKPPHVYVWDETREALKKVAELHVSDPREPGRCLSCSTRFPCPTAKALEVHS